MKVLHVIPAVAERYGGPSAAVRGMTAALADRGLEVTVVATNADGPGSLPVPVERPIVDRGVISIYFGRSLPGEYKFSWPLTRWLRRNVARFDVVHVHALFSYTTLPACRLAHRAGVPYVLRPLGTLGSWGLAHRAWKKLPYLALVERSHLRRAAAIHVTSEAERDAVAALGYAAAARVIPLGVDVVASDVVAARSATAAAELARADAPLRVLFLSRLHPVKQLPLLLEAVARADAAGERPIALTIAGDGAPEYRQELERAAAQLRLRHPVRFLGHVDGAAKDLAFDSAHLFALPSSHENFGIAAAEALARGLPVLVSDAVGIATDVAAAGAGCVVHSDADTMAAAIADLARSPEALSRMSEAALSLARRAYSWPSTAAQLEALYREVVAPATRGK